MSYLKHIGPVSLLSSYMKHPSHPILSFLLLTELYHFPEYTSSILASGQWCGVQWRLEPNRKLTHDVSSEFFPGPGMIANSQGHSLGCEHSIHLTEKCSNFAALHFWTKLWYLTNCCYIFFRINNNWLEISSSDKLLENEKLERHFIFQCSDLSIRIYLHFTPK